MKRLNHLYRKPSRVITALYERAGLILFLGLAAASPGVLAADLKTILKNWTDNIKAMGPFLVVLFTVGGLLCLGLGIWKMAVARKRNEPLSEGLTYAIVGSFLMAVIALSGGLSETTFGSNQARSGLNELGL